MNDDLEKDAEGPVEQIFLIALAAQKQIATLKSELEAANVKAEAAIKEALDQCERAEDAKIEVERLRGVLDQIGWRGFDITKARQMARDAISNSLPAAGAAQTPPVAEPKQKSTAAAPSAVAPAKGLVQPALEGNLSAGPLAVCSNCHQPKTCSCSICERDFCLSCYDNHRHQNDIRFKPPATVRTIPHGKDNWDAFKAVEAKYVRLPDFDWGWLCWNEALKWAYSREPKESK
jgi:hypothetical protein